MKILATTLLLIASASTYAEIPDWYKRDIVGHIGKAYGVVIFHVKKITNESAQGQYHSYRIDSETIETLKGSAPKGACYMIRTEGEWKSPYKVGEEAIVILYIQYLGECGAIEPGYGAPATKEYVELFKSIIKNGA
ncbi:hypothetical protein [uncultured Microbulbifer sp.]|uniref:hypothetical protein n=1 Tax=uncultured Microbulbifer sp. TaxID=348147 RepID=UPI00262D2479|nr:hypothetical protein [uncultured Microbulbifer sp.]